ncbi:MAG: SGNH/GDSL hydrolase family protein [Proteobacteria bacterium]|nr:SGNH/GDSL hydrolase family protein [Pseudomonadota bacterium]MBS0301829.1 SGNH/GDSL hydrolase family protein [Pseudomonadota bacterium]
MAANWMRRSFLAAACAATTLLVACGSSTVESAFTPTRFVAFGDGLADVGQNGSGYTVNDGSINNWTSQLASSFGGTIAPVSAGGLSYAQGNARVALTPDAAGNAGTLTVAQQVDKFLASQKIGDGDLVLISAGVSDVIAGMAAVQAGTLTADQYVAAVGQAGLDLATQARRLSNAGAKHILMTGTYDLSRTPWALAINQQSLISQASLSFNTNLLKSISDLSKTVRYVDAAYYVNLYQGNPGGFGFTDGVTPVCTSVDPGPGIGIGTGQVNSNLCTVNTLLSGANQNAYLFADKVYITPSAQRQFGASAYSFLRLQW